MPKERKERSVSIDKSRASPYKCSTSQPTKQSLTKNPLQNKQNLQEWEDARCPVCMEHPHNAILLLCSSHDKGCRPFMCDTSYRHSNCFDQFRKSSTISQPVDQLTEESQPFASMRTMTEESQPSDPFAETLPGTSLSLIAEDEKSKSKMVCPLCRGEVNGWVVADDARVFMNTKTRTCANETCEFSGTYTELRKHARLDHPLARPSEADPERQRDWRRMERQRDLADLLSTLQSTINEEQNDDGSNGSLSFDEGGWLTVFFLIRVFRPESGSWSGSSRARTQVTVRRRLRPRLWGESESRDDGNESSDSGSGSGPHTLFQLSRRRPAPDNEES